MEIVYQVKLLQKHCKNSCLVFIFYFLCLNEILINLIQAKNNVITGEVNADLPITFSPKEDCIKQISSNVKMCHQKVLQLHENKDNLTGSFAEFDIRTEWACQLECLKNKNCLAYRAIIEGEDEVHCDLMEQNDKIQLWQGSSKLLFQIICCRLKEIQFKKKDLLMFYNPQKACRSVVTKNVKQCKNKIWHVQDNAKLKVRHYLGNSLINLRSCLNECLKEAKCIHVSINWSRRLCYKLTYTENNPDSSTKFDVFIGWSSYSLACCEILKAQDVPTIQDIDNKCHPESKLTCSNLAWVVVDNVLLQKELILTKDKLNLNECLELCLNTPNCTAITQEKNKNKCKIFNEKYVQHKNSNFVSYFLNCCEPIV